MRAYPASGSDTEIVHDLSSPEALVERDAEIARCETLLGAALERKGNALLVEGPPGIGKSALLAVLSSRATTAGARLLRARAGEHESSFAFGVVRQLFEPVLALEADRRELLRGAAGLCAAVFSYDAAAVAPDPSFGTLHGLYWLALNAAERAPLAVVVDDLHWCDGPSLRALLYLVRRLDGAPIILAAAARGSESGRDPGVLEAFRAEPATTTLALAPLGRDAVATMVRRGLADADAPFAEAVHAASAGNPLVVRELVRAVTRQRLPADAVTARRLLSLGAGSLAGLVAQRISPLGPEALALARALAVLGERADVHAAAALADLSFEAADRALAALARADVVAGQRVAFVHPVVRAAVYDGIGAATRATWHARAARALASAGAPAAEVASHLLEAPPGSVPSASGSLREAGRQAARQGAMDAASAYLRRALRESPAPSAELLLELGQAESASDPEAAARALTDAVDLAADPRAAARAAVALAGVLFARGRSADAIAARTRAARGLGPTETDLAYELEAELIGVARFEPALYPEASERLRQLGDPRGDGVGARGLMALVASELARDGSDPDRARDLAERALAGSEAIEARSWLPFAAAQVLVHLDRFAPALSVYETAIVKARSIGSPFLFALASSFRSQVMLRSGDLVAAEIDARQAVDAAHSYGLGGWLPGWVAFCLAEAQLERGGWDDAAKSLERAGIGADVPRTYQLNWYLAARARVRAARGQSEDALADLRAVGQRLAALGVRDPAQLAWRSETARLLHRLGQAEEARRLAEEELILARRWGAPRAVGMALGALGVVSGGADGLGLLREAAEVLASSPAALEHARALTELGAALRRSGKRSEARDVLGRAVELADRCGATGLAERAHRELLATGARPRRLARTGVDALTPSERRVAELAASGLTNADIAQALFVTPRTVESHLSSAYGKLGIVSRSQLVRVFAASAPSARAAR